MAKPTQHDKDLRDSRILKGRLLNLQKLTNALLENDPLAMLLTKQDAADLSEVKQVFNRMLGRLNGVSMPEKK